MHVHGLQCGGRRLGDARFESGTSSASAHGEVIGFGQAGSNAHLSTRKTGRKLRQRGNCEQRLQRNPQRVEPAVDLVSRGHDLRDEGAFGHVKTVHELIQCVPCAAQLRGGRGRLRGPMLELGEPIAHELVSPRASPGLPEVTEQMDPDGGAVALGSFAGAAGGSSSWHGPFPPCLPRRARATGG